ncbi:hypothetical protein B0H10DRAFT_2215379 [Mycena sp. CBHHK59/15]|nr:hypothetical protein B0H10DRAFT_2215379 [Mycena sp. CBHHK59/15]
MAYFNNQVQPFEESQGHSAPKAASPDDLKAFYQDMERKEIVERKLSKRKSNSLWSRKSVKRTSTSQQAVHALQTPAPSTTSPSTSSLHRDRPTSVGDGDAESSDLVPPMPHSRSIIPDLLKELPAWYRDELHFSVRYNMHNPVGPRWYKNHHLIPPSHSRPATHPPSIFSPSFPAMNSSGVLQDRSEDVTRMPGLSRSSSNEPLQSPNSSQTRMDNVANLPRSRKTSQTAHDDVDLLDGSDPWGTAWHHESPYDVGLSSNSPVSIEENPQAVRSRTSSMTTAQNRRKTVTPSPLSQSTSAVHLQVPVGAHLPRKLSKRRTVGIFGGRHAASLPTSPVDVANSREPSPQPPHRGPPSFVPVVSTTKQERRGSVLSRLAKRFSITRKPAPVMAMEVVRQPSPEKLHWDQIKRVPPPLLREESSFVVIPPKTEAPKVEADRASSISLDADVTYTMGRLTVANPDPGSVESTPVQRELSLSAEEGRKQAVEHERGATDDTILSPAPSVTSPSPHPMQSISPEPPIQCPQSSASFVRDARSPEPIPAPSVPSRQHSPEKMAYSRSQSRTASPPPPSAPEKPAASSSNSHRSGRSPSGHRNSVERSSFPTSNGMQSQSSLGRVHSPPAGNRLIEKPQPPTPSPPSPKLPTVPFPADYGPTPTLPPSELSYPLPEITADISPLSASSILVNPPTPYTKDMLMPDEPEPMPPPVPSKRSSRDPSPSQVSVTGRETETFRLVRSSSGNVYASSETIRAAGEQWEVVESSKSKGKNRSRDWESEGRRELLRQARAERDAEAEQPKVRSERSRRRQSAEGSNSQTFPRSDSVDRHHRSPIPDSLVSRQEEPRTNRHKRDSERKLERERKTADPMLNKPQPPAPPSRTLERNPSKSARPISEVPTTEDMNTMRAREAWDMDRLWKARSMSGMEPNGVAVAPMPSGPVPPEKHTQGLPAVYGSSHTAFMVSTPFQQSSSSQIYHSMPHGPPPAVYPAGYPSSNGFPRAPPLDHASNTSVPRPPLANPLPEPPRESPYEPAPLTLPEYWGKHTTVTTAH